MSGSIRARPARVIRTIASCVLVVLVLVVPHSVASADPGTQAPAPEDPTLSQRIESDQAVSTDTAVLEKGHVDLGPVASDGEFRLMIHDDAADPPVWRDPDRAVLRIRDAAQVQVPDDQDYEFLGAAPGQAVHVVSQTQQPDVVWIGWNTQDPGVLERVDRGVRLSLLGVQGPGRLSVYLQSGAFGPPEVLWRSDRDEPQSIWVDLNTHTHANWVFTRPGAYLIRVEVAADLVDGSTERAVADLRVAVGDATDPQQALSLEPGPELVGAESVPGASGDAVAGEPAGSAGGGTGAAGGGSIRAWWWAAGIGAGLLIVSVAAAARGARRSRRAALRTEGN